MASSQRFLPTTRADIDARGWAQLDIIIVTGDAYVDHPAFGPVAHRALPRRARLQGRASSRSRTGTRAEPFTRAGQAAAVLRRHRRQPRLDAQPAHRAEEEPRRRISTRPGGRTGLPARPRDASSTRNRCREAFPGRADRARRHRGVAAAHRPLRLLDRHGAPLDPARRQGRPARLRHGRAAGLGGRATGCARARRIDAASATCAAPRTSINDARGKALEADPARVRHATASPWCCRRTRRSCADKARLRADVARLPATRPTRTTRGRCCSAHGDQARLLQPARRCRSRRARRRWTSCTTCRSTRAPHPIVRRERDPGLRDGEALDRD